MDQTCCHDIALSPASALGLATPCTFYCGHIYSPWSSFSTSNSSSACSISCAVDLQHDSAQTSNHNELVRLTRCGPEPDDVCTFAKISFDLRATPPYEAPSMPSSVWLSSLLFDPGSPLNLKACNFLSVVNIPQLHLLDPVVLDERGYAEEFFLIPEQDESHMY